MTNINSGQEGPTRGESPEELNERLGKIPLPQLAMSGGYNVTVENNGQTALLTGYLDMQPDNNLIVTLENGGKAYWDIDKTVFVSAEERSYQRR